MSIAVLAAIVTCLMGCTSHAGAGTEHLAVTPPRGAYADYDSLYRLGRDMSVIHLNYRADSAYSVHDIERCMAWLRVAVARPFEDISPKEHFSYTLALSNLGYLWMSEKNNPEQAYNLFMRALQLVPKVDSANYIKSAVEGNLAELYMYYHDTAKALEWYRKSFRSHYPHPSADNVNMTWVELAHFAWLHGKSDSIKAEAEAYRRSPARGKGRIGEYGALLLQAHDRSAAADRTGAVRLLGRADSVLAAGKGHERYRALNRLVAANEAAKTQPSQAQAALAQAYALIRAGEMNHLLDVYYATLAALQRAQGQPDLAFRSEYAALKVRDSLFNAQRYGSMRDIQTAWEASTFDAKLRDANEQKQREAERRARATQAAIVLGVALAAIIALLIYSRRQNRQLNQANRELYRKAMQQAEPGNLKFALLSEDAKKGTPPTEDGMLTENDEPEPATPLDDAAEMAKLDIIYHKVENFMSRESGIYDPEFSIITLGEAISVPRKQVSRAINLVGCKNFSTLVAEYRIREACRRLTSDRRPPVDVVAEEVGYRSRSHFSKIFKTITGLTVTDFVKQANST